jgi:hypothetical protein
MEGKNKENAGNIVDNGVGSCDICHGNHYVSHVHGGLILLQKPLQTVDTSYSNCPICVVQNATTTEHGPVTNSNDRGQLHQ